MTVQHLLAQLYFISLSFQILVVSVLSIYELLSDFDFNLSQLNIYLFASFYRIEGSYIILENISNQFYFISIVKIYRIGDQK